MEEEGRGAKETSGVWKESRAREREPAEEDCEEESEGLRDMTWLGFLRSICTN